MHCHQNVLFQHCSHLNNQARSGNMDINTFANPRTDNYISFYLPFSLYYDSIG